MRPSRRIQSETDSGIIAFDHRVEIYRVTVGFSGVMNSREPKRLKTHGEKAGVPWYDHQFEWPDGRQVRNISRIPMLPTEATPALGLP